MKSNSDPASWDTPDRKQEALLTDYRETREEVRQEMQFRNKRVTQGLAATGVLVAYGLQAEEPVALAFVPVIIAFVSILTMLGHESVLLLARHIAEIEAELPYESFNWETEYGEATPDNERTPEGFSKIIQLGSVYFVGAATYVIFAGFGYFSIKRAMYSPIFEVSASTVVLFLYGLVTILLVVRYAVHRRVKAEIQEQIQTEVLEDE